MTHYLWTLDGRTWIEHDSGVVRSPSAMQHAKDQGYVRAIPQDMLDAFIAAVLLATSNV